MSSLKDLRILFWEIYICIYTHTHIYINGMLSFCLLLWLFHNAKNAFLNVCYFTRVYVMQQGGYYSLNLSLNSMKSGANWSKS